MNLEENFPTPIGYFTEDHLIDRSATTYEKSTADRWMKKGWPVFNLYNREAFQSIIDERDELKAENEALRKDAERYRWLRSRDNEGHLHAIICYRNSNSMTQCFLDGVQADAVIDGLIKEAAMSKEG